MRPFAVIGWLMLVVLGAGCKPSSNVTPPNDAGWDGDGSVPDGGPDAGDTGADPGGADDGGGVGAFQTINAPEPPPVEGVVLDVETGVPVSGAEVRLDGEPVTAGADGQFSFAARGRGRAVLEAVAQDYLPWRREIMIGALSPRAWVFLRRLPAATTVGPGGGSVQDTGARLDFAPGTFSSDTLVRAAWMPAVQGRAWGHEFFVRDESGAVFRLLGKLAVEASAQPSTPVQAWVPMSCGEENLVLLEPAAGGLWRKAGDSLGASGGLRRFDLPHFSDWAVATTDPDGWVVTDMSGEVFAFWKDGSWMSNLQVKIGASYASGTIVRTCSTGHLRLQNPAYTMNLGPSTYARLRIVKKPDWVDYLVMLFYGTLRDLLRNDPDEKKKMGIETPTMTIGTRGTSLSLAACPVNGAPMEQVVVDEGEIEAITPDGTFVVAQGERLTNCPGCPAAVVCPATTDDAILSRVEEVPDCQALGQRCETNHQCCDGTFCPGFADCLEGRVCCHPRGGACAITRECCEGSCAGGICQ